VPASETFAWPRLMQIHAVEIWACQLLLRTIPTDRQTNRQVRRGLGDCGLPLSWATLLKPFHLLSVLHTPRYHRQSLFQRQPFRHLLKWREVTCVSAWHMHAGAVMPCTNQPPPQGRHRRHVRITGEAGAKTSSRLNAIWTTLPDICRSVSIRTLYSTLWYKMCSWVINKYECTVDPKRVCATTVTADCEIVGPCFHLTPHIQLSVHVHLLPYLQLISVNNSAAVCACSHCPTYKQTWTAIVPKWGHISCLPSPYPARSDQLRGCALRWPDVIHSRKWEWAAWLAHYAVRRVSLQTGPLLNRHGSSISSSGGSKIVVVYSTHSIHLNISTLVAMSFEIRPLTRNYYELVVCTVHVS